MDRWSWPRKTPQDPDRRWGRPGAGQPRCLTDNQTTSLVAVIGRDGTAGPYMACKGSEGRPWCHASSLPATPPRVTSRGSCVLSGFDCLPAATWGRGRERSRTRGRGQVFTRQRPQVRNLSRPPPNSTGQQLDPKLWGAEAATGRLLGPRWGAQPGRERPKRPRTTKGSHRHHLSSSAGMFGPSTPRPEPIVDSLSHRGNQALLERTHGASTGVKLACLLRIFTVLSFCAVLSPFLL